MVAKLLNPANSAEQLKDGEFAHLWAHSFDLIDEIATIQDENLQIVKANKAAQNFFNTTKEQLVGQFCYTIFRGTTSPCSGCPLLETLVDGRERRSSLRHENLGMTFEVVSAVYSSTNTSKKYLIHIAKNITRNLETGLELKESDDRFSKAFNGSPAPMVISEIESGRLIDFNRRWLEMLEYTREELIGKSTLGAGIWESVEERKILVSKFKETGRIKEYPLKFRTKSGKLKSALWSAEKIALKGQELMLSLIYDNSERQKAELERARLISAMEQVNDVIVITNTNGLVRYVNPAFESVTGYSREEVVGKNPRILQSGEHSSEFYRELWATISSGKTFKGRMVNRRKDGTVFTEEATISPIIDDNGTITNYIGIKRDITERLQLEKQLQHAQKMESVGRLTGGVAHDFNNILGVIIGYTQMALEKINPESDLFKDLEIVHASADRSVQIVKQLLAFSRQQPIAPKIVDLNQTIESINKMLRRLIGEDIELVLLPHKNLPPIKIDPSQIDQILANLCVNARDAISGTGKITVETGVAVLDEDYCHDHVGFKPGSYVQMTVSDSGCGMDKSVQSKVFEPFFTTKEQGRGTGLGLSMVYGIVKQNNGFINIYSEPDRGTIIKIYLPPCAENVVERIKDQRKNVPRGAGQVILIVEDDESLLKLAKKMIQTLGYNPLTASTPQQALEVANDYKGDIDLLLTDVVMPEMDGRELAAELTKIYPQLKKIFMSGYSVNTISYDNVLDPGINFLQKPFSSRDLAMNLQEVFSSDDDY